MGGGRGSGAAKIYYSLSCQKAVQFIIREKIGKSGRLGGSVGGVKKALGMQMFLSNSIFKKNIKIYNKVCMTFVGGNKMQ